jgi:RNA polymerase sigma factor (TIGR02999 family)
VSGSSEQRPTEDFTALLQRVQAGDAGAADGALRLVYDELRAVAAHRMAHVPSSDTLQPTALVHEAWLRLAGSGRQDLEGRRHFVAWAARAMHDIVVEQARRHASLKRGGGRQRVPLEDGPEGASAWSEELLDLGEALAEFAEEQPEAAQVVRLRSLAGLTLAETAEALEWPVIRVRREWAWARAWLLRRLGGRSSGSEPHPGKKS